MDLKEKIYKSAHTYAEWDLVPNKESTMFAMDELSKIVAIAFFKWFYETYNEQYEGLPVSGNTTLGGMTVFIDKEERPFEYAYELFTQSKEYQELMDGK